MKATDGAAALLLFFIPYSRRIPLKRFFSVVCLMLWQEIQPAAADFTAKRFHSPQANFTRPKDEFRCIGCIAADALSVPSAQAGEEGHDRDDDDDRDEQLCEAEYHHRQNADHNEESEAEHRPEDLPAEPEQTPCESEAQYQQCNGEENEHFVI